MQRQIIRYSPASRRDDDEHESSDGDPRKLFMDRGECHGGDAREATDFSFSGDERERTDFSSFSGDERERTDFSKGSYLSDGEDESVDATPRIFRQSPCRRALVFTAGVATLALGVLGVSSAWSSWASPPPGRPQNSGPPNFSRPPPQLSDAAPRSLLEAPETVDIVCDSIRGIKPTDLSDSDLRVGVQRLLRDLDVLLEENLDASNRAALKRASLSAADWRDLARALGALQDVRLQKLGHRMFQIVRSSNSSVPHEVAQQLRHELLSTSGELEKLRRVVMTEHFEEVLRKWAGRRKEQRFNETVGFWSGALSPETLEEMKRQRSQEISQSAVTSKTIKVKDIGDHLRSLVKRAGRGAAPATAAAAGGQLGRLAMRLRRRLMTVDATFKKGSWANPGDIGWTKRGVSIGTVVLVFALQILILLDMFNKDFHMPTWMWLMIVAPVEGASVATCSFGLTMWCQTVFGAFGLDVLRVWLSDEIEANDKYMAPPPTVHGLPASAPNLPAPGPNGLPAPAT